MWFTKPTPLPRWQLVIQGFFDDSGKEGQKDSPYICLAGYLAPQDNWSSFMEGWAHALARHHIKEFHMKEMSGRPGLDALIEELTGVIERAMLIGIGVSIDAAAWKAVPPAAKNKLGSAQQFAVQRIMRMTMDRVVDAHRPINLVFDQDEKYCGSRLQLYFKVRKEYPDFRMLFPAISFATARYCYPLQAADLLAHQMRRSTIELSQGGEMTSYFQRLNAINYEHEHWTGDIARVLTLSEPEWPASVRNLPACAAPAP
jgi:hypothetical protein